MKRYLFIALIGLIALVGTSCLTPPTDTKKATAYDATQDARLSTVEGMLQGPNGLQAIVGTIQTKIAGISDIPSLIARVSAIEPRLTAVEAKAGTGGTGGVSQAQFDALSARIKTIEDWKSTHGTSSGGSSSNPSEGILSSHGVMELELERSVEEELWLDDGVSQTWRLTVRNTGSSGTYFRVTANFDCEESVAITSAVLTPDYSASSAVVALPSTLSGTLSNLTYNLATSSTNNKIWIGKGREESLYITLKIDYAGTVTGKRWFWDFSIREINY